VRSELKANQAVEGWLTRYCQPHRDEDVCWDVEVSRGIDRLPSDDVTVNEAVVSAMKMFVTSVMHALLYITLLTKCVNSDKRTA